MLRKTTILVAAGLAALTLVAAVPTGTASGPWACDQDDRVTAWGTSVGFYGGDCGGAYAYRDGGCLDVIWGVHTPAGGVGGRNTCESGAWFRLVLA